MQRNNYSYNKKILFFIIMFIVFIRSAFRSYSVGNDTETYLHTFTAVSSVDSLVGLLSTGLILTQEIGYLLLNLICYKLFNHYQSILIVSSLFVFWGYYKFIKKYTTSLFLAFATFFLLRFSDEAMNIIRQSIAMVIILHSFDCIKTNNIKKYSLLIVAAFLFHKTALVFAPAWWFCKMQFGKIMISRFLVISVLIMILLKIGLSFLVPIMGRYSTYMTDDYDYTSGGKIAPLLNVLIYLTILLFVNRQIHITSKKNNHISLIKNMMSMRNLLFTGICILIVSLSNALIFRVALYYCMFVIVLLPNAIMLSKNRLLWSFVVLLALFSYYFVVIYYRPEWNLVYPYTFFWENLFIS